MICVPNLKQGSRPTRASGSASSRAAITPAAAHTTRSRSSRTITSSCSPCARPAAAGRRRPPGIPGQGWRATLHRAAERRSRGGRGRDAHARRRRERSGGGRAAHAGRAGAALAVGAARPGQPAADLLHPAPVAAGRRRRGTPASIPTACWVRSAPTSPSLTSPGRRELRTRARHAGAARAARRRHQADMAVFDLGPTGLTVAQPMEPGPARRGARAPGPGPFQVLYKTRSMDAAAKWMADHGMPKTKTRRPQAAQKNKKKKKTKINKKNKTKEKKH